MTKVFDSEGKFLERDPVFSSWGRASADLLGNSQNIWKMTQSGARLVADLGPAGLAESQALKGVREAACSVNSLLSGASSFKHTISVGRGICEVCQSPSKKRFCKVGISTCKLAASVISLTQGLYRFGAFVVSKAALYALKFVKYLLKCPLDIWRVCKLVKWLRGQACPRNAEPGKISEHLYKAERLTRVVLLVKTVTFFIFRSICFSFLCLGTPVTPVICTLSAAASLIARIGYHFVLSRSKTLALSEQVGYFRGRLLQA